MIYTAIDTFYLTPAQLEDSPSRKDGVDKESETALRIYGAELVQEAGILLKLPQVVMATGQVLLHRFFSKQSFCRYNVKRVAASCVWLAAKLEETPRRIRDILFVFHRINQRREGLPLEPLEQFCKVYDELRTELIRMERHLLKELGFICHVEHPHKFIPIYLEQLCVKDPAVQQEAWSLANDSLRTTLCVRFKSEVVACGVIYAATRRARIPLPEDPAWWLIFDATKPEIDDVCRVLADLYRRPKAKYVEVGKEHSTILSTRAWEPPPSKVQAGNSPTPPPATAKGAEVPGSKTLNEAKSEALTAKSSTKIEDEEERRSATEKEIPVQNGKHEVDDAELEDALANGGSVGSQPSRRGNSLSPREFPSPALGNGKAKGEGRSSKRSKGSRSLSSQEGEGVREGLERREGLEKRRSLRQCGGGEKGSGSEGSVSDEDAKVVVKEVGDEDWVIRDDPYNAFVSKKRKSPVGGARRRGSEEEEGLRSEGEDDALKRQRRDGSTSKQTRRDEEESGREDGRDREPRDGRGDGKVRVDDVFERIRKRPRENSAREGGERPALYKGGTDQNHKVVGVYDSRDRQEYSGRNGGNRSDRVPLKEFPRGRDARAGGGRAQGRDRSTWETEGSGSRFSGHDRQRPGRSEGRMDRDSTAASQGSMGRGPAGRGPYRGK